MLHIIRNHNFLDNNNNIQLDDIGARRAKIGLISLGVVFMDNIEFQRIL